MTLLMLYIPLFTPRMGLQWPLCLSSIYPLFVTQSCFHSSSLLKHTHAWYDICMCVCLTAEHSEMVQTRHAHARNRQKEPPIISPRCLAPRAILVDICSHTRDRLQCAFFCANNMAEGQEPKMGRRLTAVL